MVLFTSSVNFQDLLIIMIYFNPQRWIQEFFSTFPLLLKSEWFRSWLRLLFIRFIREVKQHRRQREQQKSSRFRSAKQQLCTCITLFCTFLCRHYTTSYDVKLQLPNFTFYGGREHITTNFFFFLWTQIQSFGIKLLKKSPTFDKLKELQ